MSSSCGLGNWGGPLPGDPSNDIVLSATAAFGGIDLSWAYPSTNPFAVSYIKVFRGSSANFGSAIKIAEVAGTAYFDKIETVSTYFYWIQIISNNGTVAAVVGPASATSRLKLAELVSLLANAIDEGLLATSLRSRIDEISLLGTALEAETDARLADNASLQTILEVSDLEMDAIRNQLLAEISIRSTNASALVTSLAAEALARANADAAETSSRVAALTLESRNRIESAEASAEALLRSILAQEAATLNAATTVALARRELTEVIQAGVSAEAASRLLLAAKLVTDIAATTALISSESVARSTAIAAEATQRDLLSAQFRGSYTGNDINAVTSGLLYQERIARATEDTALAQSITLLSAGAGEQFDWASIWYFDAGVESWTGNGSPTQASGFLRAADQASNAYVESPTDLGIDGAKYRQVRLRARKTGTVTWGGYLYWKGTGDTTWDNARRIALTEPTWDVNGIGLVTTSPIFPATVKQIRVDLSSVQDVSNYMELDWVAVGRPSPGASSAQLLTEQTARIDADTAITTSVTTLSSQVNNASNGLPAAHSLITSNYSALATADTAIAGTVTLLTARVGVTENDIAAAEADIISNYNTLVAADTAEANSRIALTAVVNDTDTGLPKTRADLLNFQAVQAGANNSSAQDVRSLKVQSQEADATVLRAILAGEDVRKTSNMTLALAREELNTKINVGIEAEASARLTLVSVVGANAAILASEQLTRATADSALASSITAMGTTVAGNTAALVTEQSTRASADLAMAVDISNLSATVVDPATGLLATRATLLGSYYTGATVDAAISSNATYLRAYANVSSKSFRQPGAPTSRGVDPETAAVLPLRAGDLWTDTDDANRQYQYTGSAWVVASDTADFDAFVSGTYGPAVSGINSNISGLTDSRIESWFQVGDPSLSWGGTAASHTGDLWYSGTTKLLKSWSGTAWVTVENQAAIDAASAAAAAQGTANGKIVTFVQASPPTAFAPGDLWIDSDDENNPYRWSGSAWNSIRDGSISTVNARVTTVENAKIGYCTLGGAATDHTNRTTCEAAGGAWNVGLPIAQAVKQVTVSDGAGSATLESRFTAQKTLNDGLQAQQTIKLDVNGHVSGYGIYANATGSSEFIVNAGRFAVTSPDSLVPVWTIGETVPVNATRRVGSGSGKVLVCKVSGVTSGVTPSVAGSIGTRVIDGGVVWQIASRVPLAVLSAGTTINGTVFEQGTYLDGAYILNASIYGGHIAVDSITVDRLKAGTLSSDFIFTGQLSAATGNFIGSMSINGRTWLSGNGAWLGMDGGYARLHIGSADQYMRYDGQTGALTIKLAEPVIVSGPVATMGSQFVSGVAIQQNGSVSVVAEIEFRSDGRIWEYRTSGAGTTENSQVGLWYSPVTTGIGSQFDIRFDLLPGQAGTHYSSAAEGVWTQISTDVSAGLYWTSATQDMFEARGNYSIRRRSDNQNVGGGPFSLDITREF